MHVRESRRVYGGPVASARGHSREAVHTSTYLPACSSQQLKLDIIKVKSTPKFQKLLPVNSDERRVIKRYVYVIRSYSIAL